MSKLMIRVNKSQSRPTAAVRTFWRSRQTDTVIAADICQRLVEELLHLLHWPRLVHSPGTPESHRDFWKAAKPGFDQRPVADLGKHVAMVLVVVDPVQVCQLGRGSERSPDVGDNLSANAGRAGEQDVYCVMDIQVVGQFRGDLCRCVSLGSFCTTQLCNCLS